MAYDQKVKKKLAIGFFWILCTIRHSRHNFRQLWHGDLAGMDNLVYIFYTSEK